MPDPQPIKIDTVKDGILPQRLSVSDVLRNSDKDFLLFTPALLMTHGGFDRDPVVEFASYYSEFSSARTACIDLCNDHEFFFRGLGIRFAPNTNKPINWDKRLYAVPKSAAEDCFAFLAGICWANSATGFFAYSVPHTIEILDPTAASAVALTVHAFGVAANNFVAYLDPKTSPASVRVISTDAPGDVLRGLGLSVKPQLITNPFEA
jgi:hypothetical protein